jgi:predicted small secreted protein
MKTLATVLAGLLALTLAACNTIAGAGKDIKQAGEVIEDVAKPDR